MALSDACIHRAIGIGIWQAYRGHRQVEVDELKIGPNSVDVTLGDKALFVKAVGHGHLKHIIDPEVPESIETTEIDLRPGWILYPEQLMLSYVLERFNCNHRLNDRLYYQVFDGRSTLGRLGVTTHQTAGRGDYGFCGNFTVELKTTFPILLRAGMRIGQIYFEPIEGDVLHSYDSVYAGQVDAPKAPVLGKDRF